MTNDEMPPTITDKLFALALATLVALGVMGMIANLMGCGDDRVPAPDAPTKTWGDAHEVWASSWCAYAERCSPGPYEETFPGGYAQCIARVKDLNCAQAEHPCDELYPTENDDALGRCSVDMAALPCGETRAPDSCYEAFQ